MPVTLRLVVVFRRDVDISGVCPNVMFEASSAYQKNGEAYLRAAVFG